MEYSGIDTLTKRQVSAEAFVSVQTFTQEKTEEKHSSLNEIFGRNLT